MDTTTVFTPHQPQESSALLKEISLLSPEYHTDEMALSDATSHGPSLHATSNPGDCYYLCGEKAPVSFGNAKEKNSNGIILRHVRLRAVICAAMQDREEAYILCNALFSFL